MSKNNERKAKKTRFVGIPHHVVTSPQFATLSGNDVKMLVCLLLQYNGNNNGNMSPSHALMKKYGWATSTIYRSVTRLEHSGFIVITRQGTMVRGDATLVAVTWNAIDDHRRRRYDEDVEATITPLKLWEKPKKLWKHQPRRKKPKK